jgi:hypothetical protein
MRKFPITNKTTSVSRNTEKNATGVAGVPSNFPFPNGAPVKVAAYIAAK